MSDDVQADEELRCIEFVDLVTAYLDGELEDPQRRRIDAHLAGCAGCRAALDQFETVIGLAGRLTPADVTVLDPSSVTGSCPRCGYSGGRRHQGPRSASGPWVMTGSAPPPSTRIPFPGAGPSRRMSSHLAAMMRRRRVAARDGAAR